METIFNLIIKKIIMSVYQRKLNYSRSGFSLKMCFMRCYDERDKITTVPPAISSHT